MGTSWGLIALIGLSGIWAFAFIFRKNLNSKFGDKIVRIAVLALILFSITGFQMPGALATTDKQLLYDCTGKQTNLLA